MRRAFRSATILLPVTIVCLFASDAAAQTAPAVVHRVLATSKTSTMEKELHEAADAGYFYKGQTIFQSSFGGDEVVVILERDKDAVNRPQEYKLLATSKTSTLEKEVQQSGAVGYEVVGMTLAKTALGGKELVAILKRPRVD